MSRVLVVDDEKGIRQTLCEFLRKENHEVDMASEAAEALRLLTETSYDVIVTDILLPRISGVRLLQAIRETDRHVQVILITGEPTVDTAAEALRLGAFDYLSKPIAKTTIIKTVANAARMKSLEDDNRRHQEHLEQLVEERTREIKKSHDHLAQSQLRYLAVLRSTPHGLCLLNSDWIVEYASRAMSRILGLPPDKTEMLPGTPLASFFPNPAEFEKYHESALSTFETEGADRRELVMARSNGTPFWAEISMVRHDPHDPRSGYVATVTDISIRKRMELEREVLRCLSQCLTQPLNIRSIGLAIAEQTKRLFGHDAFLFDLFDEARNSFHGVYYEDTPPETAEPVEVATDPEHIYAGWAAGVLLHPVLHNRDEAETAGVAEKAGLTTFGYHQRRSRSLMFAPIRWEEKTVGVLSVQSYTPNRYDESDLRLLEMFADQCGGALVRARAEERLQNILASIDDVIWSRHPEDKAFFYLSPAVETITERGAAEFLADPILWERIIHPEDREGVLNIFAALDQQEDFELSYRIVRPNGTVRWIHDRGSLTRGPNGHPRSIDGIFADITQRKEAEEQVQRHVQRMAALRAVDMTITASLDLKMTLHVLLEQVTSQLKVDAADILLLNPFSYTLTYVAGRGFRTKALQFTRLRLGEGNAGRAALDRKILSMPDLTRDHEGRELIRNSPHLREEHFLAYIAVPLLTKGRVSGVLELFHRAPLNPDQDWMDFLEALSMQAAIAIDNASLFEDLQRSHTELTLAYDSTLEGWSRALEYRDIETHGHALRVTEATVRLAHQLGTPREEMVHLRRGALLHDIGKMGIPDHILLKPGPLTAEEWEVMRMHPVYAYEMLNAITYLRPALDIPYCHHEKWDGTGYPRGLRGEDIPLSARIFAVIDVADALSSDRPYRKAWDRAKVVEHLASLGGTHFDPEVLKTFLDMDITLGDHPEKKVS